MELRDLQYKIHQTAKEKGWWDRRKLTTEEISKIRVRLEAEGIDFADIDDEGLHAIYNAFQEITTPPRNISEMLMLMVTEIAEAEEEYRNGQLLDGVRMEENKPEGFGVELADAIIRILDTAEGLGIDLQYLVSLKMKYNETRPHRHGGKKA